MGGQPALGLLLRKSWQHWPAHAFLRSSLARAAVHLIDADIVGYGILMPEIRLSKLLRKLRPFVDAGLKRQLVRPCTPVANPCVLLLLRLWALRAASIFGMQVVVVGGRRPPFKRDRGTPVYDGDTASTYHALFACAKALRADGFQVRSHAAVLSTWPSDALRAAVLIAGRVGGAGNTGAHYIVCISIEYLILFAQASCRLYLRSLNAIGELWSFRGRWRGVAAPPLSTAETMTM